MKWNVMEWRKEGKKEWNETNEGRRKAGMNDWMNEWSPEFNETTFHFHTLSYKPNYSFDKSQHCPERQWHTPNWSIIIGLKWAQSTMILTNIIRHWYDQQSLIDVCQQNTMYMYMYIYYYIRINITHRVWPGGPYPRAMLATHWFNHPCVRGFPCHNMSLS
jgi:hypothetical protein